MCELQRCWRRLCYLWADPSSPSTPLFFQSLRLAQLNKLLPLAACFSRDHGDINLLIELQSSRLTAQLQQQVAIRDGAKIGICGVKLGFCFLRKETKGLRDQAGNHKCNSTCSSQEPRINPLRGEVIGGHSFPSRRLLNSLLHI